MLVCVSVNPAIDKRVHLAKLVPGHVNRVNAVRPAAGGKAAHVAMVLRGLGADPRWIGFAGGSSGTELLEGLRDLGIRTIAVLVKNATRTNLEVIEKDGTVTEILEPGAMVSAEECSAMESACEAVLREGRGDVLAIFSGSLPLGMPREFYARLIEKVHAHGGKAFLDTSGEPLKAGLEAAPDFVKPNREEAEWMTGKKIDDASSAATAISRLISAGAKSAVISLGKDGLVWQPQQSNRVYYARSVKVAARSAVGSGDATVAGFAYAAETKMGLEDSLKLAAACGAANCLADLPGQVNASDVPRLRELVKVEALS